MRKLIVCILVALVAFTATPVFAIETLQQVGVGFMNRIGEDSRFCYFAGFDIPIVQKSEAGFAFKTELSYLYSDKFGSSEVQAIRTMAWAEKNLLTRSHVVNVVNDEKLEEVYFRWYLGGGSGTWNFTKNEGDDQTFGVVGLRTGVAYNWIRAQVGLEIVQLDGPDTFVPQIGFGFDF